MTLATASAGMLSGLIEFVDGLNRDGRSCTVVVTSRQGVVLDAPPNREPKKDEPSEKVAHSTFVGVEVKEEAVDSDSDDSTCGMLGSAGANPLQVARDGVARSLGLPDAAVGSAKSAVDFAAKSLDYDYVVQEIEGRARSFYKSLEGYDEVALRGVMNDFLWMMDEQELLFLVAKFRCILQGDGLKVFDRMLTESGSRVEDPIDPETAAHIHLARARTARRIRSVSSQGSVTKLGASGAPSPFSRWAQVSEAMGISSPGTPSAQMKSSSKLSGNVTPTSVASEADSVKAFTLAAMRGPPKAKYTKSLPGGPPTCTRADTSNSFKGLSEMSQEESEQAENERKMPGERDIYSHLKNTINPFNSYPVLNKKKGEGLQVGAMLDQLLPKDMLKREFDSENYWAIEFARITRMTGYKGEEVMMALSELTRDFVSVAALYARVLASERYMPIHRKSIKPIDAGGVAGGEKYKCAGIFFKFAIDNSGLYGSDLNAAKAARHDLLGLSHIALNKPRHLNVPIGCVIDYKGVSVLAISRLPIDRRSIVYGSSDGGRTVHNDDPEANMMMSLLGRKLNLKPHMCGNTLMHLCGDIEVHRSKNNELFALDMARIFPSEPPSEAVKDSKEGGSSTNPMLIHLMRPEMVAANDVALCSDAFTLWDESPEDERKQNSADVESCFQMMMQEMVPRVASIIDSSLRDHTGGLLTSLDAILHENGVNMRHLGAVYNHLKEDNAKILIMSDMAARTHKRVLLQLFGTANERFSGVPLTEPFLFIVRSYLNHLLMGTETGKSIWKLVGKVAKEKYYTCTCPEDFDDMANRINVREFTKRLCEMISIDIDYHTIGILPDSIGTPELTSNTQKSQGHVDLDEPFSLHSMGQMPSPTPVSAQNRKSSSRQSAGINDFSASAPFHEANVSHLGLVTHIMTTVLIGTGLKAFRRAEACKNLSLKAHILRESMDAFERAPVDQFVKGMLPKVKLHLTITNLQMIVAGEIGRMNEVLGIARTTAVIHKSAVTSFDADFRRSTDCLEQQTELLEEFATLEVKAVLLFRQVHWLTQHRGIVLSDADTFYLERMRILCEVVGPDTIAGEVARVLVLKMRQEKGDGRSDLYKSLIDLRAEIPYRRRASCYYRASHLALMLPMLPLYVPTGGVHISSIIAELAKIYEQIESKNGTIGGLSPELKTEFPIPPEASRLRSMSPTPGSTDWITKRRNSAGLMEGSDQFKGSQSIDQTIADGGVFGKAAMETAADMVPFMCTFAGELEFGAQCLHIVESFIYNTTTQTTLSSLFYLAAAFLLSQSMSHLTHINKRILVVLNNHVSEEQGRIAMNCFQGVRLAREFWEVRTVASFQEYFDLIQDLCDVGLSSFAALIPVFFTVAVRMRNELGGYTDTIETGEFAVQVLTHLGATVFLSDIGSEMAYAYYKQAREAKDRHSPDAATELAGKALKLAQEARQEARRLGLDLSEAKACHLCQQVVTMFGSHLKMDPDRAAQQAHNDLRRIDEVLSTVSESSPLLWPRFQSIYARVPPFVIVNKDGIILGANGVSKSLLHEALTDLIGQPVTSVLSHSDRLMESLSKYIREDPTYSRTSRIPAVVTTKTGTHPVDVMIRNGNAAGTYDLVVRKRDRADEVADLLQSSVPTLCISQDSTILRCNPAALAVFGHEESLEGESIEVLLMDDDRDRHALMMKALMAAPQSKGALSRPRNVRAQRKDGSQVNLEIVISETTLEEERIPVFICMFREMTNLASTVSNHTVDQIMSAVVSSNREGVITLFNDAASELFGYKAPEIVGRNVKVLMKEEVAVKHDSFVRRYLKSKKALLMRKPRMMDCVAKGGRIFRAEVALSEGGTNDDDRMFTAVVSVPRDEVVQAGNKVASVLMNATEPIVVVSSDGKVDTANNAALQLFDVCLATYKGTDISDWTMEGYAITEYSDMIPVTPMGHLDCDYAAWRTASTANSSLVWIIWYRQMTAKPRSEDGDPMVAPSPLSPSPMSSISAPSRAGAQISTTHSKSAKTKEPHMLLTTPPPLKKSGSSFGMSAGAAVQSFDAWMKAQSKSHGGLTSPLLAASTAESPRRTTPKTMRKQVLTDTSSRAQDNQNEGPTEFVTSMPKPYVRRNRSLSEGGS